MRRFLRCALCCSAALIGGPATASDLIPVFKCVLSASLPGGGGPLLVLKSFRENGDVNSVEVTWEDNAASGIARSTDPTDRIFTSLRWPGEHQIFQPVDVIDWSQGSIALTLIRANAVDNFALEPGEEWRQVIVDRDQSIKMINESGRPFASSSSLGPLLKSDLEPTTAPNRFVMSLDAFFAWGTGVQRLTVYETRVQRRLPLTNRYPTSPVGAQRILGAYDVNMSSLARTVASIQSKTEQWERVISGNWHNCKHDTEGGDVVVTDRPRP